MLYHLIALVVAAVATIRGFRQGLSAQTPAIIGTSIGIVCARLLAPGLLDLLYGAFPSVHGHVEQAFVYDTIASAIVFFSVYAVFRVLTGFLGKVLHTGDRSILDNIGGALFELFKWMLMLSILFNMTVALGFGSPLLKAAKSDDGNISIGVMKLAPALLGGEDIEDLALKIQLEEAKKISKTDFCENQNATRNV